MHVFLTGAGGRLGRLIIPHLLDRGHTVTALVRSEASAKTLPTLNAGSDFVIGTIEDFELLAKMAMSHDAVIHTAFDWKTDFEAACKLDKKVVEIFGAAMEGSHKKLLMSSGVAAFGWDGNARDEFTPNTEGVFAGRDAAQTAFDLKDKGVTSIVVRLACLTHSGDSLHAILGMILGMEDNLGVVPYIGEGSTHFTACNANDAALLYVLVMEKGEPGTNVHAVQERIKVRDIAEGLARKTGKKAGSVTPDQVAVWGIGGVLLNKDQNVTWDWTERTFGWKARGQSLLDEIASGSEGYMG